MEINRKFVDWLAAELEEREWNNADLARRSGISEGQISHIFSGTRGAGNSTLEKIAEALKLPKEEVLRRAGLLPEPPDHDPLLQEVIGLFDRLNSDKKELARNLIRSLLETGEKKKKKKK